MVSTFIAGSHHIGPRTPKKKNNNNNRFGKHNNSNNLQRQVSKLRYGPRVSL